MSLEIVGVRKAYGEHEVLKGVSLSVLNNSYFVLLGPSGSGKTTLLSILGGFVRPTSGRVVLDGEDITWTTPAVRPTTTVFQDYALFPHMTVAGNVAFGLRMHGVKRAEAKARAAASGGREGTKGARALRLAEKVRESALITSFHLKAVDGGPRWPLPRWAAPARRARSRHRPPAGAQLHHIVRSGRPAPLPADGEAGSRSFLAGGSRLVLAARRVRSRHDAEGSRAARRFRARAVRSPGRTFVQRRRRHAHARLRRRVGRDRPAPPGPLFSTAAVTAPSTRCATR